MTVILKKIVMFYDRIGDGNMKLLSEFKVPQFHTEIILFKRQIKICMELDLRDSNFLGKEFGRLYSLFKYSNNIVSNEYLQDFK